MPDGMTVAYVRALNEVAEATQAALDRGGDRRLQALSLGRLACAFDYCMDADIEDLAREVCNDVGITKELIDRLIDDDVIEVAQKMSDANWMPRLCERNGPVAG